MNQTVVTVEAELGVVLTELLSLQAERNGKTLPEEALSVLTSKVSSTYEGAALDRALRSHNL